MICKNLFHEILLKHFYRRVKFFNLTRLFNDVRMCMVMDKKDLADRNEIILLMDIYGKLLTDKQRYILELYFFEDFSLAEISKINDSSRQSILCSINKSIDILKNFEDKLGILKRDKDFKVKKEEIVKKLNKYLGNNFDDELNRLIENL